MKIFTDRFLKTEIFYDVKVNPKTLETRNREKYKNNKYEFQLVGLQNISVKPCTTHMPRNNLRPGAVSDGVK